MVTADLH